jgi:LysM repeat protein
MRIFFSILMAALLVAGCAKPKPEPAPPTAREEQRPEPPKPPPPPPPAPPPHSPTTAEKAAAQERALLAAELLQDAKVNETRTELMRSLKLDPQNVLATTLMRQLNEDPTAILGKESFPYKVASGDTLSRIADRFLGDKYMFYALARYNNIATPKNLQAGQTIKILGKPPAVVAVRPPPPTPAPIPVPPTTASANDAAAIRACDNMLALYKSADQQRAAGRTDKFLEQLDKTHEAYRECGRLGAQNTTLIAKRDQLKRPIADGYYREGMKAYYNQDLDLSIHLLQRVVEVDPDYQLAADNLRKAKDLKARLQSQQ